MNDLRTSKYFAPHKTKKILIHLHSTIDALHCNPETTEQINKAGGSYLIQVKENQAELLRQCKKIYQEDLPLGVKEDVEKEHGRLTTRLGGTFKIDPTTLDKRWEPSGINTLVVLERDTMEMTTKK